MLQRLLKRYLIISFCTTCYKKGKANLLAQAEQDNNFLLHSPTKIHVNLICKPYYPVQTDLWQEKCE